MYLCRAALQRFSPLTRPCITHRAVLHRDVVPRRLMSSVPGGSGENLVYVLLCGGAFAGSVAYTYRTITRDSARYSDRVSEIAARPKVEWKPKPWPPKSAEEAEEAAEETAETVVETVSEVVVDDAEPVVLAAEVKTEAGSVVEKVAEVVVETAETVAEVASVVEMTAQEVAAVAHEVEKIAEEVEAAAKKLETTVLPAVEEADAESNGTAASSQQEAATDSAETEA
ncbi:protein MGARP isoform X2 [Trichomycterus rosablanca]|uniref:protein MGARP isoform X2 n=1 Tax=Trichomycterus rosablanca TaxID=2290929 RepID=UPI002F358C85